MLSARSQKICVIIAVITTCIISFPAYAKYSGGTGEPNDPYQIAAAADLIALGETPGDYDKDFILTADIDLAPSLPGRKVFANAVIASDSGNLWGNFQNIPFTGVFDGNGHNISNLTITGTNYLGLFGVLGSGAKVNNLGLVNVNITASGEYIGALAGKNDHGTLTSCYSTGTIAGKSSAGGLVGLNSYGYIFSCHSTCKVSGNSNEISYTGGLIGYNSYGTIAQCCSSGMVSISSYKDMGTSCAGGLVGFNSYGILTQCYSSSAVKGNYDVGGLVGNDSFGKVTKCYSTGSVAKNQTSAFFGLSHIGGMIGACFRSFISQCYSIGPVTAGREGEGLLGQQTSCVVTACFWDTQTSLKPESLTGGIGMTTAEMKTRSTFIDAGWDLTDESANGTADIWRLCENQDYPKLVWQIPEGDFVCPQGITMDDFDFFMDHWGDTNCVPSNNYCHGTDLDFSGTVDLGDYEILLSLWLSENP